MCNPGCQLILPPPVQCIMLPSYTGELFLLFSGPQRSQGIMQHRACKFYASSHVGKDLENLQRKEWLNFLPASSSQGRCAPACLKIHSSITGSLIILSWCNFPRKHFHLSHPTPLFPLCWYESYSAQRSGCGN